MTLVKDPGLQPERTRLAWHRTALAMGACALLQVREAVLSEKALSFAAAAALAMAAAGLLLIGRRRLRELQSTSHRAPAAWMIKVVWGCSVLAAGAVGWAMGPG